MKFEWDSEKNRINIIKHGIDFETASRVFEDECRIEMYDKAHSDHEDRYVTIGMVKEVVCVLVVVYVERDGAIRLITARKATDRERRSYYDYSQRN